MRNKNMRDFKYILTFLIIVTSLFSCSCSEPNLEPEFSLHNADFHNQFDYDIYNFILEKYYSDSSLVIIRQKVEYSLPRPFYYSDYYTDIKKNMPKVDTTAYLNFISINDSVSFMDNSFKLKTSTVKLISENEWNYYFDKGQDAWKYFYRKYPKSGGIIELSRIGYNKEKNQAIIEVFLDKSWTGSRAYMYFITKENNNWVVTNSKLTRTNY